MKNKSKRASALVLLLLPIFCQYAATMEIPDPFTTRNLRSLQNGRHVAAKKEATLNGGLDGPLPVGVRSVPTTPTKLSYSPRSAISQGKRRSLASLTVTGNPDVEDEKECSLSSAVLAQITKPSADEWLVDDKTVKLLNSNLQELIRCTKRFDKVFFNTTTVIELTETIKILHKLRFLRIPQTTLESKDNNADMTVFTCPKSGPVFLVQASNFVAVGITIANCKKSASHGTIIVRSRSVATLKHVRIEDNRITGVYISKDASVTLHDAYFSRNTVVGNGAAIHSKGNAYVTITNSTFKENYAQNGHGAAICLGNADSVIINDSTITMNYADYRGGGLSVANETNLTMFKCKISNNEANGGGGGIDLWQNNTAIMHSVVLADNTAKDGGAILAKMDNTFTITDCVVSNNRATYGGAFYAENGNNAIIIDSILSNNEAMDGGALHASEYNNATIIDSILSNNVVYYDGGGMYLDSKNTVVLQKSRLLDNNAEYGGAFYAENENNAIIIDSILSNNTAHDDGGGMYLASKNSVVLQKCRLLDNVATSGGALFASWHNKATFLESILSRNYGEYNTEYGKGLYFCGESNVLVVKTTNISRNNAQGAETSNPHSAMDTAVNAARVALIEDEAKHAESVVY